MRKLLNLLYIVTSIIYILPYNFGNDIQEIDVLSEPNKQYVVLQNEPLHIILNSNGKNITASGVSCIGRDDIPIDNIRQTTRLDCNSETIKFITRLEIPAVTAKMSTKWYCNYTMFEGSDITSFEIKVRGIKSVNVSIDGISRIFKTTNLSVTEYDGVYVHEYVEGENIDFVCKNINKGSVLLRYYDAYGNIILESDQLRGPLSFSPLLRVQDNGSYVDCIYITDLITLLYQQEFTYRTVFTMTNKTGINDYIVTINDTPLILKQQNYSQRIDKYYYKFIPREELKITCEKVFHDDDAIYMDKYNNGDVEKIKAKSSDMSDTGKYTFFIDTKSLEDVTLKCYSPDSKDFLAADIKLDKANDPVIVGLPESGLLYQFSKNDSAWIMHYRYTQDEKLNLACKTNTRMKLKWIIPNQKPKKPKHKYIVTELTITADYNNSEIVCEATLKDNKSRTVTIVFHQKPETSPIFDDGKTEDKPVFMMIISCVIAIGVIIMTTVCACCFCLKIRNSSLKKSPYKNFKNEDASPIPTYPRQWDSNEYSYIINSNFHNTNEYNITMENSLYIGGPKNNPNDVENIYTEIDDTVPNKMNSIAPDYSLPNKQIDNRSKMTKANPIFTINPYTEVGDRLNYEKGNMSPPYSVPYEQHEVRQIATDAIPNYVNNVIKIEDGGDKREEAGDSQAYCNVNVDNTIADSNNYVNVAKEDIL